MALNELNQNGRDDFDRDIEKTNIVNIAPHGLNSAELREVANALDKLVTRIADEGEKNRWAEHKTINRKIVLSRSLVHKTEQYQILETVNTIDYVIGKFIDRSRVDMLCENPSIEVVIRK